MSYDKDFWFRAGNKGGKYPPLPIPIGPQYVLARILIRTPKVPFWIPSEMLFVGLASLGRKRRK